MHMHEFGPHNMGRKSNVYAHNNRSVPVEVLTSLNSAPWCVVRKSLLYPPIELLGHRASAWQVMKCVPLVTNFVIEAISLCRWRGWNRRFTAQTQNLRDLDFEGIPER
jgi:hypothetical protein